MLLFTLQKASCIFFTFMNSILSILAQIFSSVSGWKLSLLIVCQRKGECEDKEVCESEGECEREGEDDDYEGEDKGRGEDHDEGEDQHED